MENGFIFALVEGSHPARYQNSEREPRSKQKDVIEREEEELKKLKWSYEDRGACWEQSSLLIFMNYEISCMYKLQFLSCLFNPVRMRFLPAGFIVFFFGLAASHEEIYPPSRGNCPHGWFDGISLYSKNDYDYLTIYDMSYIILGWPKTLVDWCDWLWGGRSLEMGEERRGSGGLSLV